MRQYLTIAGLFGMLAGMSACAGGGGSSLGGSAASSAVVPAARLDRAAAASTSASSYSYTAPWGGLSGGGIYVAPQGACGYIAATAGSGYSWPTFLSTLAAGTVVTVSGTPTYNNNWSVQNNCPTGGIVATNIVVGQGGGGATPSPTPSAPSGGGGAPIFGSEPPNYDPPASWQPYRSSSTWNQRLSNPDNPTLDPNDGAKMYAMFNSAFGANQYQGRLGVPYSSALATGSGNGGIPYYFAKNSDPLVTINCTAPFGTCTLQGKQYHVPAKAASATDTDRHIVVIQPNGYELDVWEWAVNFSGGGIQNPPWYSGETINVGWGGVADAANGTGWDDGGNGATAAGNGALAGIIREPEMASGQIKHALTASVFCSPTSTPVYPATHSSSQANCNGAWLSSSQIVAEGSRLWLDLSDSQINASSFTNAQKTVLHALHDYGAFVTDTNSYDPLTIGGLESQMPGYAYGNDSVGQWAAANLPEWYAWNGATWYYTLSANDVSNVLESHLHVLAPCVSTGFPGGQC